MSDGSRFFCHKSRLVILLFAGLGTLLSATNVYSVANPALATSFTSADPARTNTYMDVGGTWDGVADASNTGDSFTLTITNNAVGLPVNDSAFDLDINLTVPAGFVVPANTVNVVNVIGTPTCPDITATALQPGGAGNPVQLNVPNNTDIEPSCSYTFTFGMRTDNTVTTATYPVDYTVTYNAINNTPASQVNVPITQNIEVRTGALTISKSTVTTTAVDTDVITYDITVTSTGTGGLFDVALTDIISTDLDPLSLTFNAPALPPGAVGPANVYTFEYLAAGEVVNLTVDATVASVNACPVLQNDASLSERTGVSTATNGATVDFDFQFTSGLPTSVVTHNVITSFCELCDDGEIRIIVQNPTGAPLTDIVITEDLQLSGFVYIPLSTTTTLGSVLAEPTPSGTSLIWTSTELDALASLAGGTSFEIRFRVTTTDEALITANRNIFATADFEMACLAATTSVNSGQFEVPIRQPEPTVIKAGRNYDAGQGGYSDPVYGSTNDDVIWRVNIQNTGLANMEALLINDGLIGTNFVINWICPTEASAVTSASSVNGATQGAGCIAMTDPLDVDDPFGNPAGDEATTFYDVPPTSNAFVYYVGRINNECANNTNNADISWGCEVDSPGGGSITVPASTGGVTPSVTVADAGTLSTFVNTGNLNVIQTVTGSNPAQPLGTKGIVTVTLQNLTGGSVKNIVLRNLLPVGYVVDDTFSRVENFTRAYGAYPGMIDTITRVDAGFGTPADPLDDVEPIYTLTSSSTGLDAAEQVDLLRHGDTVTITIGIIMIEPDLNNYTHYDLFADLDVAPELPGADDPTNAVALTNEVGVDFTTVCAPAAVVQPPVDPAVLNVNADPEDLDVSMSDPLYIVTNDLLNPVPLTVLVTNNGGHDADDYVVYVTLGEAMTILNTGAFPVPAGCAVTSNPPPRAVWDTPAFIPATAVVYECTGAPISPGPPLALTFYATQNLTPITDDLTFRADVIGEMTLSDGTVLDVANSAALNFPPVLTTATVPAAQIDNVANNYSLDAFRSRVLGFNLTKTLPGNCSEDNPAPIANTNVTIGEDCTYHIQSGGWFGFQTPGFTLIEVRNIVVTDDMPNGQGYINHAFTLTGNISTPIVINSGAGSTPLSEVDVTWAFNPTGQGITVRDELFQVDITTRLLNDDVDNIVAGPLNPNTHSQVWPDIARTEFDAVFDTTTIFVDDAVGIPGYPVEALRRIDMTVTEPNLIITKQVCNETLYGVGTGCTNFTNLADDGDTDDTYIYRVTIENELNSSAVQRSPAYNVILTDTLDASDLMRIVPFAGDGLDNDGDGDIDAADLDGESTISENVADGTTPAVITISNTHSVPLQRVNPNTGPTEIVTFYYRVDPDDAIAPLQTLTNTVISSYDSLAGDFGAQNIPQLDNTATAPNDAGRARIYTTDTPAGRAQASIQVIPLVAQPKAVITLSNTTLGAAPHDVVVGEEIEYQLTALLPVAHLRNFVIRDELPAGIRCIEGQVVNLNAGVYAAAGFVPGGTFASTCTSTGTNDYVEWDFGNQELMTAPVGTRFTFPISFIARVDNTAINVEGRTATNGGGLPGGTDVTVTYNDEVLPVPNTITLDFAPVTITVREPQITLTKSFAPVVNSDAGDVLTVTVTATNTSTTVSAYNLRVLDALVGTDLVYAGNISGTDPPDNVTITADGPVFSWNLANPDYEILPTAVKTFTFDVEVDTAAQPLEILDNTIEGIWNSLPDLNTALNTITGTIGADGTALGLRNGNLPNTATAPNIYETTASASTSVLPLTVTKTDLNLALPPTIGAHKNFQIEIALPEGNTSNLVITDDLIFSGLSYVLSHNATFDVTYTFQDIVTINGVAADEAAFNAFPADNSSGNVVWDIGAVVTNEEDDSAVNAVNPLIRINYFARINNDLVTDVGDTLQNSATVNYSNGETPATTEAITDTTAVVTVVEPDTMAVTKVMVLNVTNPGVAPDGGDILQYRVSVTNNGNADAFDVNIVDTLPAELLFDTGFTPTATVGVPVLGFVPIPSSSPAGPLIWGRNNTDNTPADNTLDIPVGQTLVLTYQVVVQPLSVLNLTIDNSVTVDWTSLDNDSVYERTGAGCPTITAPNDYCVGPIASVIATVEPDLNVDKRGPAGTIQYGVGIPYTLVVENVGTGAAFDINLVDQLPDVADNPPLTGGTCDTTPLNFVARITTSIDEVTVVRALAEGVDYTVVHTAAPTCELVVTTLTASARIEPNEKFIISYDAFLDTGSQQLAQLTNIAGVTQWFAQDTDGTGNTDGIEFNRTITNGTIAIVDHEDAFTVVVEAPVVDVQKTVINVTTGQNRADDASPGDVLRYTITVINTGIVDATSVIATDAIPANTSYVPDSVLLNGLPVGQPDGGVFPFVAGVDVSSSDLTPPLPAAGSGTVSAGQTATLTFDVLLDPVITSGTVIENQAQINSPETGTLASDDPDENGNDNPLIIGDEDTTKTLVSSAPVFQVEKISDDITGDPALLEAGDTLRYTLTVKNIGSENSINTYLSDQIPANTTYVVNTTTLNGVMVTDPVVGISALESNMLINAPENVTAGFMRADTDVAADNVATITFDVVVSNSAVIGTIISNQGFVGGDGAGTSGAFPVQPSDDPATALADDPTIDIVGNVPLFDAQKTVAIVVDGGTPGIVDPGDVLRYTITTTNMGAIPITNVVLTDAVPANTTYVPDSVYLNTLPVAQPDLGVSPLIAGIYVSSSDLTPPLPVAGSGTLTPGQIAVVTFDVLVDAVATPGTVISNQGFISSNELPVEPTDADGIDANGDQPTIVIVGNPPLLTITKQVFVIGGGTAQAGSELEYVVRVTNNNIVPVSYVVITDDLDLPVAGQMTYVAGSGLLNGLATGVSFLGTTVTADYSTTYGDLAPAGIVELRFRVILDAALNIGDTVTNIGDVSWNLPAYTASASVSITIGGIPGTVILNGQVWHDADFTNDVGASERLLQDWTVELYRNSIFLATTLTDVNGLFQFSGLAPNLTSGIPYELRYIAPGATASTASLGLTDSAFTNNPQSITDILADYGDVVTDLNLPIQPNGVVYDSVLRTPVAGTQLTLLRTATGAALPATCFNDAAQQNQITLQDGYYKFDLNFSQPECPSGNDYTIQVTAPPSGFLSTPSRIIPPATATLNVPVCSIDAVAVTPHCEVQTSEVHPPPSVSATSAGTDYYLSLSFSVPVPVNSQLFNNHIPIDSDLNQAVSVRKTTTMINVTRSQLVPYVITLNHVYPVTLENINLVDTFPAGFKYVQGSACINTDVAGVTECVPTEPVASGLQLTWPIVDFAPDIDQVIKLLLVVGAGVSENEYVNRAQVFNTLTGNASNVATATVRVVPDPTFDCTDVIGKVFDDKNANGYQDEGETGLASARVITARGLEAIADEHGRFHITCAVVPNEDRGSNFILKLDERSLPVGYRLTTENPRVLRATRGKMLKFNFGTAIHRVVRLDMADAVFEPGTTTMRPQWISRVSQLMDKLVEAPSVLRLSYMGDSENASIVEDRLQTVKEEIEHRWSELDCCYRLEIETEVFWRRGKPADMGAFE